MANFAVDSGSSQGDILSSLNYALANLDTNTNANVLVANTTTGQITNNTTGQVLAYLYQYICVVYSTTAGGTISYSPTNQNYFGILNNDTGVFSTNPADYVWTQVTGGFGTTKYLWYAALGGRQIQWFAGTTPPQSNYTQVINSTAINLDIITGAVSNQLINESVYLRANSQPATPTGGTFDFTTLTLYPPSGWSTTVPTNANVYVYTSSAIFSGNTGNVLPSTAWSYPTVLASNFAGNTGPQGSRGPIPLGYVITDSDPTYWVDSQYNTAFQAPRANVVAPIGVSPSGQVYTPISGDTAQFFYPTTQVTLVKQFSSNTTPNWQAVLANVVSGNVIYTGTITSSALNANDIYAINIAGGGGAIGDIYTHGYWLQANTGSAAFGGNVYVGDLLKVGLNAQIGANLNVGTNANIGNNLRVGTNAQIGSNLNVGTNAVVGNNLNVGQNAQIGANLNVGLNANIGNNLRVGSNAQISGNLNVTGLITQGSLSNNTVQTLTISPNNVSTYVTNGSSASQTFNNIGTGSGTGTTTSYYTTAQASITPSYVGQQVFVTAACNYFINSGSTPATYPTLTGQLIMQYVDSGFTQYRTVGGFNVYPTLTGTGQYRGQILVYAQVTLPYNFPPTLGVPYTFYINLSASTFIPIPNTLTFTNGAVNIQNLYR